MRTKIYNLLVNRCPGIKQRYHRYHDGTQGAKKLASWLYLLWLNFAYYILQQRFLGVVEEAAVYEEKRLEHRRSESSKARKIIGTAEAFVERLSGYDVISFDIFDTLIFRPFSDPTDLFYFVGEKLGILNFKDIRCKMEQQARELCHKNKGHYEVSLEEIWKYIERKTGFSAASGSCLEAALEKQFCYANPFMSEVFGKLRERGKKIILVSDMYLPAAVLEEILKSNGFCGYEKLFVSCEYGKSKAEGSLFELVQKEYQGKLVHVGDNCHSDVAMVKKYGLESCYYPNVNAQGKKYRAYDMSKMVGGAYRGLVNNYLYHGSVELSIEQEYGFIYGGLFVAGYCSFIHEYCRQHQIDKILFLSRDGDIVKQVYDMLFPGEKTGYAYWSRRAAVKLMAGEDKLDYFRRFLYHKVNQGITLEKIFASMELERLAEKFFQEENTEKEKNGLNRSSVLTDKNIARVKHFLDCHWEEVLESYAGEQKAAKVYFEEMLKGCCKAVAVDIGWAGSGAIALNHLVQRVWKIVAKVYL